MVQGVLCNLTLIPQSAPRDETAALGQLRLAAALGIHFVDISNLPLRINSLVLRHIFVNPRMLLSHVTRHLVVQVKGGLLPPVLLMHPEQTAVIAWASVFLAYSRVSSPSQSSVCPVQALQQMHKILGQVDIVGVPFTLGSSLFEGFSGLIMKPAQAKSPAEFFDSLGHGLFILFRNAMFGVLHAFGQVSPLPVML